MSTPHDLLRLNVGFIAHETVGYSRDFLIEVPSLQIPPDLNLIEFSAKIRVTRTPQGLLVQARLHAFAASECVRCLREFSLPMETGFTELYAFSPDSVTESGYLMPENGKIDLTQVTREEMLLAMPISPLCQPDCKGLCPTCGEDLNETTCNHEADNIDPRLDVLKSLLK